MNNKLPGLIKQLQEVLQYSDWNMAKYLNITVDTFKAVKEGRLLPYPARKYYERKVVAKLKGLEMV